MPKCEFANVSQIAVSYLLRTSCNYVCAHCVWAIQNYIVSRCIAVSSRGGLLSPKWKCMWRRMCCCWYENRFHCFIWISLFPFVLPVLFRHAHPTEWSLSWFVARRLAWCSRTGVTVRVVGALLALLGPPCPGPAPPGLVLPCSSNIRLPKRAP